MTKIDTVDLLLQHARGKCPRYRLRGVIVTVGCPSTGIGRPKFWDRARYYIILGPAGIRIMEMK